MSPPTRTNGFQDHTSGFTIVAHSGNSPPAFAFVTHTGPPSKSRGTQKLVRSHVMRQVGKARRNGRPAKAPLLQFDLEVPNEPFLNEASLQLSYDQFLMQPTVERVGDALDQDPSGPPSTLDIGTSDVHDSHMVGPQQKTIQSSQDSRQIEDANSSGNERHRSEDVLSRIEWLWVGRSDPFVRYPIKMNSRANELIDHMFNSQSIHCKTFRDALFPVGMMDPATFHQVLAKSALNISSLRNVDRAPESYEAISHHTYAIKLVNKRLSDPIFATSDEIIGAVTAFICYYHIIGNTNSWRLHMNGIKEIVRLRGGPDSPTFNRFVRLILSVADISGSATQDIPPTFPLPFFVSPSPIYTTPISHPLLTAATSLRWRALLPSTHHSIINILDDLSRLASHLKAESRLTNGEIYKDASLASTLVNPLLHRLLCLAPSTTTSTPADIADAPDVLQEGTRLAGILYLAEIRRGFGILPVVSTIQVSKLQALLERCTSLPDIWTHFPSLRLWVLAMGVIESHAGSRERVWFCERFGEAAARAGGECGSETREAMGVDLEGETGIIARAVEKVLRRFLWLDELHGVMFRRNWQGRA